MILLLLLFTLLRYNEQFNWLQIAFLCPLLVLFFFFRRRSGRTNAKHQPFHPVSLCSQTALGASGMTEDLLHTA